MPQNYETLGSNLSQQTYNLANSPNRITQNQNPTPLGHSSKHPQAPSNSMQSALRGIDHENESSKQIQLPNALQNLQRLKAQSPPNVASFGPKPASHLGTSQGKTKVSSAPNLLNTATSKAASPNMATASNSGYHGPSVSTTRTMSLGQPLNCKNQPGQSQYPTHPAPAQPVPSHPPPNSYYASAIQPSTPGHPRRNVGGENYRYLAPPSGYPMQSKNSASTPSAPHQNQDSQNKLYQNYSPQHAGSLARKGLPPSQSFQPQSTPYNHSTTSQPPMPQPQSGKYNIEKATKNDPRHQQTYQAPKSVCPKRKQIQMNQPQPRKDQMNNKKADQRPLKVTKEASKPKSADKHGKKQKSQKSSTKGHASIPGSKAKKPKISKAGAAAAGGALLAGGALATAASLSDDDQAQEDTSTDEDSDENSENEGSALNSTYDSDSPSEQEYILNDEQSHFTSHDQMLYTQSTQNPSQEFQAYPAYASDWEGPDSYDQWGQNAQSGYVQDDELDGNFQASQAQPVEHGKDSVEITGYSHHVDDGMRSEPVDESEESCCEDCFEWLCGGACKGCCCCCDDDEENTEEERGCCVVM